MVYMEPRHFERLKTLVYHAGLLPDTVEAMETIRQAYVSLGALIIDLIPECRSKSLALTYLEDSLMRAIQALALQGVPQWADFGAEAEDTHGHNAG